MKRIYIFFLAFAFPLLLSAATDLGVIDNSTHLDDKSLGKNWESVRYIFQSKESGRFSILLEATKNTIKMKAGKRRWKQEFFRDASGNVKKREQVFDVESNEKVYLTIWKENGKKLKYDLSIKFTAEGAGDNSELETPKPFTCSQDAYLFNGSSPTNTYSINLSTGDYSPLKKIPSRFINGTGYNVKDSMIWGYDIKNKKVIRIDADFNTKAYTVAKLPDGKYYAGDVSLDGFLYLKKHDDSNLYKIDLNSGEPKFVKKIALFNNQMLKSNTTVNFGDFAFNPKDKMLYSISEKNDETYNHLYRIHPDSGLIEDLGEANKGVTVAYHTFVFDVDGNLYFYGKSGIIYKIEVSKEKYTAKPFKETDNKSGGGDGARCSLAAQPEPEMRPFTCESSGTVVSYVTSGSAQEGDSNLALLSISDGSKISDSKFPSPAKGVNSIGYNIQDNYVWGYNIPKRSIVRIGANNTINYYEMDNEPDIDGHYYNAADVSSDGVLYMKCDSFNKRLDRVVLDGTKTTQHVLESITLDHSLHTDDFAFNPKDGKIYFIDYDDGQFKRIDIVGTKGYVKDVKKVGEAYTIIAAFDVDGNFYFNNGEDINKLSISYNENVMDESSIELITSFSKVNGVTQGDGARCANASVQKVEATPFTCDDTMYFSNASDLGTHDTQDYNQMWLHKINREQSPFSFDTIGEPFKKSDTTTKELYNALAYNPADNFLYAVMKNHLMKIDKNGVVEDLGMIEGLDEQRYFAGTFGKEFMKNGTKKASYYLTMMNKKTIYKIDVESLRVSGMITADETVNAVDMVINKEGDYIYYMNRVDGKNQLSKVKITGDDKGTVVRIGLPMQESLADTIFYDQNDKIYVLFHEGGFYEIDKDTGARSAISTAPITADLNDGAMCPNATVNLKPILTIGDASIIEGDSGEKNMVFHVSWDKAATFSINYQTVENNDSDTKLNASSNVDYTYTSGAFEGNVDNDIKSVDISIPIKGDILVESDETFSLVLSNIHGLLYHDSGLIAKGTIVNDDADQNAFSCDVNSFIFTSGGYADYSKALNVNFMDDRIETLREEFNKQSDENIRGSHINAIGYNVQDNYIYGWEWDAAECKDWTCSDREEGMFNPGVVRIDKDFNIKRLDISGFPQKRQFYAGDVSLEGDYYLSGSKEASDDDVTATDEIYVIDLKNQALKSVLTLSEEVMMADFAFSPMDNKIYTIQSRVIGNTTYNDLVRIDPSVTVNGKVIVERLGDVSNSDANLSNAFTNVTFFDREGNFYFYAASNPQKSVYKIDISNPDDINTTAVLYKDIELSSGGDGARCSLAPIENMYELNITNSSAMEGDSGYNDMNITITLDREVLEESGLPFSYTITSGSEVIDADKSSGSFTIPKGVKVYNLALPVIKGDILVEENKDFKVGLSIDRDTSYTDKDVMTVDEHKVEIKFLANDIEGRVIDDDYFTFAAWDGEDASIETKKIHTQIVNGAIDLKIALVGKDGALINDSEVGQLADINHTKIRVVDVSGTNDPCDIAASEALNNDSSFLEFSMANHKKIGYLHPADQSKLMKKARVQFSWQDKVGWKTTCSSDTFAIRPNRFDIKIEPIAPDTTLKAGKEFTIKITAEDALGDTITDYTGDNQAEYVLEHNDTKVSSNAACVEGQFTPEDTTGIAFENGVATINAKYTEVGKLDFKVHEKEGAWYASVDSSDTEDAQRKIDDGVSSTKDFGIARMNVVSIFTNGGVGINGENYTYFADGGEIDEMAATLKTTVTALGGDGQALQNFSNGCYAMDVPVSLKYSVNSPSPVIPIIKRDDTDVLYPQSEVNCTATVSYDFNITTASFATGEGSNTIMINFGREKDVAKNPMKFEVKELKALLNDVNKSAILDKKETTFIYIRANVPSPQTFVGRDANITVNYEVYCDEDSGCNRSSFGGLKALAESEDAIRWYILKGFDATTNMKMDFRNPKALFSHSSSHVPYSGPSNISGPGSVLPTHTSATKMNIKVTGGLPHRDKIVYEPGAGYLVYNPTNAAATTQSFKVRAMPNTKNWAGTGKLGMTVDHNTAVGNGLQKIDW